MRNISNVPIAILFALMLSFSSSYLSASENDDEYQVNSGVDGAAAAIDYNLSKSKNKTVRRAGRIGIGGAIVDAYERIEQRKQERFLSETKKYLSKLANYKKHMENLTDLNSNKTQSSIVEIAVSSKEGYVSSGDRKVAYGIKFGSDSNEERIILSEEDFKNLFLGIKLIIEFTSLDSISTFAVSACKPKPIGNLALACDPKHKKLYLISNNHFGTSGYNDLVITKMFNNY